MPGSYTLPSQPATPSRACRPVAARLFAAVLVVAITPGPSLGAAPSSSNATPPLTTSTAPSPLSEGPGATSAVPPVARTTSPDTLPLDATRRLRFTTDEGTWMSVDVAPDGGTLVFDLLGDLYTLPVTGGRATRLTSGQPFDAQPRFSPDGRHVAFVTDRDGSDNVWILDRASGDARQVTEWERYFPVSPEWTPDGEAIVVSRNGEPVNRPQDWQLHLLHRDGGAGLVLTGDAAAGNPEHDPEQPAYLGAAFGDDPRHLYVAGGSRGGPGSWQIMVLDRETGRLFPRTVEARGAFRPAVSPDDRWLVYGTRHDGATGLKAMDLETGDASWLVEAVDRDAQESTPSRDLLPGYDFLPDGSAVVVGFGGKLWRVSVPGGERTEIPFTAEVDVPMGPLALFDDSIPDDEIRARRIENPDLSPDGSAIVFSAMGRIWTSGTEAPEPRRLTDGDLGEFFPAFSPDGRSVAYVTWDDLDGGHVWRAPADGSGPPRRLTEAPGFYQKLAWSPDGERIVVARGPRERRAEYFDELARGRLLASELAWLPAEGGPLTPITFLRASTRYAPAHYGVPHFSRDGSRVLFTDPFEGLVSVRWDGTHRRVLLKATDWEWTRVPQVPADEILLSPNGEKALVLANNNVWLVDLTGVGEPLPEISLPAAASAPLPVERLSVEGADFMGWAGDDRLWWALGDRVSLYVLPDAALAGEGYEPLTRRFPVTVPAARAEGVLALTGARLITMRGDEIIEDGTVVVRDGRIEAVGPADQVEVPPDAEVMDVTGRSVLPGWIDIHAHMWTPWGVQRSQVWEYLANLAYGVTATRDPQTMTPDVLGYADRVAAGDLVGPRIFTTARGIFPSEHIGSLDDARAVARRYADFYRTGTVKNYLVGDRKHRQWLVMAAREEGVSPTAEGNSDFKMNLTLALDGYAGVEHSLPVFPLYEDVVTLLAESGITYTPTMLINYGGPNPENLFYFERDLHADEKLRRFLPHEELDDRALRRNVWVHESQWVYEEESADAAAIVEAGGRVGLGGHGQLQGLQVHWEMWLLAEGGMTPHDVLRVGTIFSAEAIGHGDELGSLEPGKLADLQILEGNPLEDIRETASIERVMVGGRLYDASTMDEVWPRSRALPRQWWWEEGR